MTEEQLLQELTKKKFSIVLNMPKAPKGSAQLFQIDGKSMYVPFNKSVEVPFWVYVLYLDSQYNPERSVNDGVDQEHIIID